MARVIEAIMGMMMDSRWKKGQAALLFRDGITGGTFR